jgi:hypothetical protein
MRGSFRKELKSPLIARDEEETFEVTPELRAVLLQSIAECERGETISGDGLLSEMRSRE